MIIKCDRRELNKMKRRMVKAYPRERMEVLWGLIQGSGLNKEYHIYLFDQIPHIATSNDCKYELSDLEFSHKCASEAGLIVLGTIHSHPECKDATPSENDYDDSLRNGEYISGIVLINTLPSSKTKRRSIRVRFWGPLQQVEPVYL